MLQLQDPLEAYKLLAFNSLALRHSISMKILWNGTIALYSEISNLFVAWLLQNLMGYRLQDGFMEAYKADGLKMLPTYTDADTGVTIPVSPEQFKHDRQMAYATLLSCFQRGGVAKEFSEKYKKNQDGFPCWNEVKAKYDNQGSADAIRLMATAALQQAFTCGYAGGLQTCFSSRSTLFSNLQSL